MRPHLFELRDARRASFNTFSIVAQLFPVYNLRIVITRRFFDRHRKFVFVFAAKISTDASSSSISKSLFARDWWIWTLGRELLNRYLRHRQRLMDLSTLGPSSSYSRFNSIFAADYYSPDNLACSCILFFNCFFNVPINLQERESQFCAFQLYYYLHSLSWIVSVKFRLICRKEGINSVQCNYEEFRSETSIFHIPIVHKVQLCWILLQCFNIRSKAKWPHWLTFSLQKKIATKPSDNMTF